MIELKTINQNVVYNEAVGVRDSRKTKRRKSFKQYFKMSGRRIIIVPECVCCPKMQKLKLKRKQNSQEWGINKQRRIADMVIDLTESDYSDTESVGSLTNNPRTPENSPDDEIQYIRTFYPDW